MIVHRVHYIVVRRKTFLISFAVEETHRVPFAPDLAQTRRGESQRISGNALDHHMPREGDVVVDHVAQPVAGGVRLESGVVIVVRAFRDRVDGVRELTASFHFRL